MGISDCFIYFQFVTNHTIVYKIMLILEKGKNHVQIITIRSVYYKWQNLSNKIIQEKKDLHYFLHFQLITNYTI